MASEAAELQLSDLAVVGVPTRIARRYHKPRAIQFWGSITVLAFVTLLCFLGPHVLPIPNPNAEDLALHSTQRGLFTPGHLLGTDELGRDLLSRCLWGGQVSIEVALSAVGIGMLIGSTLGTTAAYLGGKVDVVIMRIIDMFLAFPALVLALAIAAYLGPNQRDEIIAISFFGITAYTRYTRAATLKLKELDFLHSSAAIGSSRRRIILRHIVPNIYGTVITFAFLTVSGAMLLEAALSFLGAGIRPPEPSWGNIIAEGQTYLGTANQIIFVPAVFLLVTVLALNLLGDAIRVRTQ